jgi:glycosyltransferase involved in cell wall biosynthesis
VSRDVVMPADIRFPLERANGVQIVKTAGALARSGVPTTLLVRESDPRSTDEILALFGIAATDGLTVVRLRVGHRPGWFAGPRAAFLIQALRHCWSARRRGASVYTRDLQLADALSYVGGRGPLCYEAHAVEALMYRERDRLYETGEIPNEAKARRIDRRERRVWRRASAFVTTTEGIGETFVERHGARERTYVIPNGCDVPDDRTFPALPADRPARVVYAGQLYPWKGVDALVEAVARVPGIRLVVLGGFDGERDLERVRALVGRLGLEGRVDMAGTVPQAQVADELRRAHVVAVPFLRAVMTEKHTSPIKAFEAMAAGRPIVASDLPSSREILTDGENALLVPPGDVAALAAAIRRLAEDRALAERLARRAFDDAPRYSWDARARRIAAVLSEVA